MLIDLIAFTHTPICFDLPVLFTPAVESVGLFERQLQVTCSFPSKNEDKADTENISGRDCSVKLANVQGYCKDGDGKEFDYCYGSATERQCRQYAEASSKAVGWARATGGYCEIYFDDKDSGSSPANLCPSGFSPNNGLNKGVGFPKSGDGNPGVPCYTCRKASKKCTTQIDGSGFCTSAIGDKYDYCHGQLSTIECEAAATKSQAVGWASTSWGYCEIYFDNSLSQYTVAPLCPVTTSQGPSTKSGVGIPANVDGTEGVSCYACSYDF